MTTMRDVADAAGVSVMTVSNVINGRPHVSAETRLRVLDVVAELGYEVNLTARRLRAGRTDTVALIVPRFDHPYFGELAAKLSVAFQQRGRHLVVEQSGASREGELAALSLARLQTYDGVLLSMVGLDYTDVDHLRTSTPIVLLGEQRTPARFDHVMMGNEEGARLATRHLFECGASRVAIAGGEMRTQRETMPTTRTAGWLRAHREVGRTASADLVLSLDQLETAHAREVTATYLRTHEPVDAVFAVTDQVAFGVMAGLRDVGLRVPEDVQVVGFDDLGISAHVGPGLTTVDPSNDWIVGRAVDLLEDKIRRRRSQRDHHREPVHLVSPVRLEVRGSTRPPSAMP